MVVNVHQDQYLKTVGEAAGLRLLVTSQNRMPFPEEEGMHVEPGRNTAISVKKVYLYF